MSLLKYVVLSGCLIKFFSLASKKLLYKIFLRNEVLKDGLEVQ